MKIEYGEPKEVIKKETIFPDKKYISFDGKEFTDESLCKEHEVSVKAALASKFYKKYNAGKLFESKTNEENYKIIEFKNQEEFNCIYGLIRGYAHVSIYGHSLNEVNVYPPIKFPITFLAEQQFYSDGEDVYMISLETFKDLLRSDLKELGE